MITYTEKERTWILCDPGEISLGMGGRLEPSITPNMFIESPSSLDLMLGMRKRPYWDCKFTSTSKILEIKHLPQNVLNPKITPGHTRKRKASWSGEFEDQERPFNSNSKENGHVKGKSLGHSSKSEDTGNLKIQNVEDRRVLSQSLRMEKSIIRKCQLRTNEFFLSKKPKISPDNVCMEDHTQQWGGKIEEKAKVPKFVSSLVNSRLKKRIKKLEASEIHEKSQGRIFSNHLQGFKITQNVVELLRPKHGSVLEEEKLVRKRKIQLLPATTLASQANKGARTLASPNSREPVSQKRISLATPRKNLQVESWTIKRQETKDSLLVGSLGRPKRRIKIVDGHGLEERCLLSIEKRKFATNSLERQFISKRAPHVDKRDLKKCCGAKLLNDHGPTSLTLERARGSSKPKKSQRSKIPFIFSASISEARNCYTGPKDGQSASAKAFQGFGSLPLNREDLRKRIMSAGPTKDINNMEGTITKEDCDLVKGGDVRVRIKRLLQLFHTIHKQFKGGHKEVDVRNIIVECYPRYLVNGNEGLYGDVPGVEAGDRFTYRVEMDLVGLHHHLRRGIDVIVASKSSWCLHEKPVSVAACIVVAGGYVDNRDEGDIIIYTGEGGNNHFYDKGPSKDQMLTFGNKALRHSMMLGLYVRVVRKFDMKPPTKPYYRYDGLYEVMEMKKERSRGKRKTWPHGRDNDKQKINKCNAKPFKPLVYKFVLVRKSTREKYKNVNLWTFKPPSQFLNNDKEVLASSSTIV